MANNNDPLNELYKHLDQLNPTPSDPQEQVLHMLKKITDKQDRIMAKLEQKG